MKRCTAYATALLFSISVSHAFAYDKGDVILRAGLTTVAPSEDSGNVYVDGGETLMSVSVDNNTQLGLNFVYALNSNWAIELLAATPFSHTISLENSGIDGELAEVTHLPPTLSALYLFADSESKIQPYAGVGLNYTIFFDESFKSSREPTFSNLELDSSFGLSVQAGFDYLLNDNWMINGSIRYISISTTANFNVGEDAASVDVDIDPWVYTLSTGYKF
ncbi:MAG: outer membrane beta-barrel protein [Agarilytica sp.]